MLMIPVFHIIPDAGCWRVVHEGEAQAATVCDSREEAIAWCRREAAGERHAEILVHGEDLAVNEELVLGDEPYLPD